MGGEFNSGLFKELHRLAGIKSSNTTPYYPQGDGQCERLNRTLVNMLKTLSAKEKGDWRSHLPKLAYAVNSTRNKTTGFSPHYLMFGREAVLPIDQVFRDVVGTSGEIVQSHMKFVRDWENSMKLAYDIAQKHINKSAEYNKQHYYKPAKAVGLKIGDRVLVQNMRQKTGKPKMRSYYEENIFQVVEVRENVPVYKIQNIKNSKDTRIVHRNKLLKVDELPLDVFEDAEVKGKEMKHQRKAKDQGKQKSVKWKDNLPEKEEHLESEESEDEDVLVVEKVFQLRDDDLNLAREEVDTVAEIGAGIDDVIGPELQEETVDVEPIAEAAEERAGELHDRDPESPPVTTRRSARTKIPRSVFTYPTLGADPVRETLSLHPQT